MITMAQEDNNQATTSQPGQAPSTTNGTGAPAGNNGNGAGTAAPAPEQSAPSFTRSPLFRIILAIAVIGLVIWGISFYNYSQNHVTTDDAYVTGDLVNISPVISGTLSQLTVEEGDAVKAGEVIAVLDQSGPLASYDAAKAAYQAAVSEIPQARTNLTYQAATTQSDINQARAALAAQNAKTSQQMQQVDLTAQTTQSQVLQAQAQASASYAQYTTQLAQAASAAQAIATARSAADAAHEQIAAAQANYTKARNDEARYTALYGSNGSIAAVTAQQLDAATQAADNSSAQLAAAQDQYNQAESAVLQARAQEVAAIATANAALKQYHAMLSQVAIARANRIQVPVQKFGVANNAAIAQQNAAELQAAIAGQSQVSLKRQQVTTAQAQAEQSKASMQNSLVNLEDCTI
jgi:membrane fusion protein (multidrug efflux system)